MKHVQNGKHISSYVDMIHSETKYTCTCYDKNANPFYSFQHYNFFFKFIVYMLI